LIGGCSTEHPFLLNEKNIAVDELDLSVAFKPLSWMDKAIKKNLKIFLVYTLTIRKNNLI
jgi:hypothetical protein